jgi:parvulin-like peptidyl-prolyl isomerase
MTCVQPFPGTLTRTIRILAAAVIAAALPAHAATAGAAPSAPTAKLPVIDGKPSVATVNGEPITLDDLLRQIGALHSGVAEPATQVHKPDPSALLQRIVNARLILQEARRIGLDGQPGFAEQVAALRESLIKSALVQRQVRDLQEPDPAAVTSIYRDAVREARIDSLLFGKEEDARAFVAAIRAAGDFAALSRAAIASGQARGGAGEQFLKVSDLRPEVAAVVARLQPQAVSDPIHVAEGFTVLRVAEVRYPENPAERAKAADAALQARQESRLEAYREDLRKRYTQVDHAVLDRLDYESKQPGLEALRRDTRVVARIRGGLPLTVRDLTEAVEKKFYHGLAGAIERKRVNGDLPQILDRLMLERATLLEAKRLGIERDADFLAALRDRTNGLLFEIFMKKVVDPEIKLQDGDLQAFYDAHRDDYSSPEMMRLEGLAFHRKADAEAALARLRQGADIKWMRSNAAGQVDPGSDPSLLQFNGALLAVPSLPEEIRRALAGAAAGDCRYEGETAGPHYVLCVAERVASQPQSFDTVKDDIARQVYGRKRQEAVEGWAVKLRQASEVKIFATDAALREILGLRGVEGA